MGFVQEFKISNIETEEYVYSTYWRIEPSFEQLLSIFDGSIDTFRSYDEYYNSDFTTNERTLLVDTPYNLPIKESLGPK